MKNNFPYVCEICGVGLTHLGGKNDDGRGWKMSQKTFEGNQNLILCNHCMANVLKEIVREKTKNIK